MAGTGEDLGHDNELNHPRQNTALTGDSVIESFA